MNNKTLLRIALSLGIAMILNACTVPESPLNNRNAVPHPKSVDREAVQRPPVARESTEADVHGGPGRFAPATAICRTRTGTCDNDETRTHPRGAARFTATKRTGRPRKVCAFYRQSHKTRRRKAGEVAIYYGAFLAAAMAKLRCAPAIFFLTLVQPFIPWRPAR